MNTQSITIGIPAYNEEANIKYLLKLLLDQKLKNAAIHEVIVVSDGSTDGTVLQVKSLKDKRIRLIDRKKRLGILKTQNEVLKHSHGDILVLLDADVLPVNNSFIEELTKPIIVDKSISLVGADTISVAPRTFFEKIITDSHEFKKYIYRKIRNQNNIYLCHGRARAFSKIFYTHLRWPDSPPEDAYSYLFCINNGYKFAFAPKAKIFFRSPTTFKDHLKQSYRFFIGMKQMEKYFSYEFVRNQYHIPKVVFWGSLFKYLIKKPLTLSMYLLILVYIRLISLRKNVQKATWDIASSSKKLIYENTH